jgi:glutamate/tyrosine decarboxylase-like PLP-dependent enzyme
MSDLLTSAARRATDYIDSLAERRVAPDAAALTALRQLHEPLPEQGTPPADTLEFLDAIGSPATMASAGPRYFGFVTGGALPVSVATNWLATAWDQNAALWVTSPVTATLEQVTLAWLLGILGLPAGGGGAFVTGASMANFTALAAARNSLFSRQGWNFKERGFAGAPPLRVVVGAEAHATVIKALWLLGFGSSTLERVAVDAQGRMDMGALPALDEHTLVCVQAGNVNSGAFDPIGAICERAQARGAWVHVDGAFGIWAAASPKYRALVAGVAAADSWSTDAHKWLNTPYDCGIALVRDPASLREALSVSAAYLPNDERREPAHFTPELSRRARVVEVWAAMRSLGRRGIARMVESNCESASLMARLLREGGLKILNEVALNQILVSAGNDAATERLIEAVQAEGTCWCGGSTWRGQRVMRISISNWSTSEADIVRSARAILRANA